MTEPKTKTRLYSIYQGMKQRCYNPNSPAYKRYGGRGIEICPQWLSKEGFENFRDWAYSAGYQEIKIPRSGLYRTKTFCPPYYGSVLTIDRIDNDGNYCPENCRWISLSDNVSKAQREKYERRTKRH